MVTAKFDVTVAGGSRSPRTSVGELTLVSAMSGCVVEGVVDRAGDDLLPDRVEVERRVRRVSVEVASDPRTSPSSSRNSQTKSCPSRSARRCSRARAPRRRWPPSPPPAGRLPLELGEAIGVGGDASWTWPVASSGRIQPNPLPPGTVGVTVMSQPCAGVVRPRRRRSGPACGSSARASTAARTTSRMNAARSSKSVTSATSISLRLSTSSRSAS